MTELARILDRGYELIWREGRLEEAFGGLPPDFEWVVPGHPEGEVWRGREAVITFFREWTEPFDDLRADWEIIEVGEGRVLAIIEMRARGHDSGAPVEMRIGQLWTFRGGVASHSVIYFDIDEARAAAGL